MTAGNWTPNRDDTLLSASAHRDLATQGLTIAGSNPAVSFVLDAMTVPPTWASLYLVYDAISADVGGKHELKKLGWLTDDQLSDLTNSANNSRASSKARGTAINQVPYARLSPSTSREY